MTARHLVTPVAAATLLCALAERAGAGVPVYQPLEQGTSWTYEGSGGSHANVEIAGEAVVLGAETVVRRELYSTMFPEVVENYWTVDASGNVFLHGAHNLTVGLILAYEPPILYLVAPLALDDTWESEFVVYDTLEGDGDPSDPMTIRWRVFSEGNLDVPYGSVYAYGVGQEPVQTTLLEWNGIGVDLLGRRVTPGVAPPGGAGPTEWYTDGIGRVRFDIFESFELSAFNPSTPTLEMTWGQVKTHF